MKKLEILIIVSAILLAGYMLVHNTYTKDYTCKVPIHSQEGVMITVEIDYTANFGYDPFKDKYICTRSIIEHEIRFDSVFRSLEDYKNRSEYINLALSSKIKEEISNYFPRTKFKINSITFYIS